jgi:hypothetical protein
MQATPLLYGLGQSLCPDNITPDLLDVVRQTPGKS